MEPVEEKQQDKESNGASLPLPYLLRTTKNLKSEPHVPPWRLLYLQRQRASPRPSALQGPGQHSLTCEQQSQNLGRTLEFRCGKTLRVDGRKPFCRSHKRRASSQALRQPWQPAL